MTSSPHRSSVELVPRARLPTNDWKDFQPQHLRTPPISPRARAESDEFRRPPPHWEGEGDQQELDALERDRAKRSRREHTPRGRPHDQKPEPRGASRSRSLSNAGVAKFRPTWNPRSHNHAIRREDLSKMLRQTFEQYGPAKNWPVEADIFEHEGLKFREHVQKRAWAQNHVPIWCLAAQEARAADEGAGTKRGPPSGFYPLTRPSVADYDQADEDALMCISSHFSGLRYMGSSRRRAEWCHKFETLTLISHYDQIWQAEKNTKEEVHRTFEILNVASDLPIADTVRLVLTEMQEKGMSVARMTHIHPPSPPSTSTNPTADLGPTKIVVVLQSYGVQNAALHFHGNERFVKYSWNNMGLQCMEPRPAYHAPPNWTMEHLWEGQHGATELEERQKLRRAHGLFNPTQGWGRFHRIPASTPLYRLGQR